MKKNLHIYILFGLTLMLWACANEPFRPATTVKSPLSITMALPGQKDYLAATRAERMDSADQWSYVGFNEGDKMGFYASGGNWMNGTYSTPFINYELTYQQGNGQFQGPNEATFDPSGMKSDEIFMYFPYSSTAENPGIPLRVTDNGIQKCQDLLSSSFLELQGTNADGKEVSLFGEFQHSFAELIIMRGEGFDNPPPDKTKITAVLTTGYTHLKITYDPEEGWNLTPSLVYDENSGLSAEEARKWVAWQGSNYGITVADEVGTPAWYVIVPTLSSYPTTVEYIEICDNDGYYQSISSLKLRDGNTKFVDPGWRYPMEITMKELVPTVNPYRIIPWGNNIDLTDERTRGINDEAEFAHWVWDYNLYLSNPNSQEYSQQLLNYGDLTTDEATNKSSWHFYILSDLDLTGYTPYIGNDTEIDIPTTDTSVIITTLAEGDILDGISTNLVNGVFQNHIISGLEATFISNLSGTLQNIEFSQPVISGSDNSPIGIVAKSINNGTVSNCDIDDGVLFMPEAPAGMIAGTMNSGRIENCEVTGALYSASTADSPEEAARLVGTNPTGSFFFENNSVIVAMP